MNVSGAAQKAPRQEISTTTDILLTGRWLAFLRPTSVIIVGFTLALWMVAIPIRYAQLATVCSAVCGDQQLSRRALAHFKASGLTLGFYSAFMGTVEVLFVLAFVVVAVVILWKKSDTRIGLITALFLTTFSVSNTDSSALAATYPVLSVPIGLIQLIGWICLGMFLFVFPDGRFSSRWTIILAAVGVAVFILSNAPFFPPALFFPCLIGYILLTLIMQIYRYRYVSTPAQRQQAKWVVSGITTAFLGIITLSTLVTVFPLSQHSNASFSLLGDTLWYVFEALIPLSIGFAIVRTKLWDIDVVINRALVYGSLTVILALIYFGLVIGLQFLVGNFTREAQSPLIIVGTTLLIAALFQPLRHRLQYTIDRRFYRRKYDATQTLATFSATLRNEVDLNQLTAQLIEVVEETMQPAHVSLWVRLPRSQTRFGEEGDLMRQ